MTQKQKSLANNLDKLVEVLMDNFIFYIPSEILFEGVIDAMEGELPDRFFDELSFYDHSVGIYLFDNSDVLEVNKKLLDKKSQLETNKQYLLQLKQSLSEEEFVYVYNEYSDRLLFFVYISTWLCDNLQRYNQDLHIAIIGAFKLQLTHLQHHTKDIYGYFGKLLQLDLNEEFTTELIVTKYVQDLIYRIQNSEEKSDEKEIISKQNDIDEKPIAITTPKQKRKKEKPTIDDDQLEKLVLTSVFNVEVNL